MMTSVTRYHPLLVILHWLIALAILAMLLVGYFVLAPMSNADPAKLDILEIHMAVGMAIFALMLIRLVTRLVTAHPPASTIGSRSLDRLTPIAHWTLYLVILLMIATGYATGILARLNETVFARSGAPLPADFNAFPTFAAHGYLALLLAALIAIHTAAALYHQLMRRDRLLARMGFGQRKIN
jgi:cytochrome b561